MKAISIRQPWAHLIVTGVKDLENRPWRTHWTGRLAIHAGQNTRYLSDDCELVRSKFGVELPEDVAIGAVIGTVDLVACVEKHPSPWFEGPFAFVLQNPKVLPEPIYLRGQLGLFNILDIK